MPDVTVPPVTLGTRQSGDGGTSSDAAEQVAAAGARRPRVDCHPRLGVNEHRGRGPGRLQSSG